MAGPTLQFFPFGRGLHQENDNRLQEPGAPRAIENLIRTKNGRLRARRDYETLAMTAEVALDNATGEVTGLQLYDLLVSGDRLLAIGTGAWTNRTPVTNSGATDLFYFQDQVRAWRRADQGNLSPVTQMRRVGGLVSQTISVESQDLAAGGGFVCSVIQTRTAGVNMLVRVFDPATDTTVLASVKNSVSCCRVVWCGSSFFIAAAFTSTGEVQLFRFTPGTDTQLVTLTSPVAATGTTVVEMDMTTAFEGTSFWLAVANANTTTALRGLDTSGTVTYTAAGPATLFKSISIFAHATVSATLRFHIMGVRTADDLIDAYTYVPPSTTPSVTNTDLFSALGTVEAEGQVSMTIDDRTSGTAALLVAFQTPGGATTFANRILTARVVISTLLPANDDNRRSGLMQAKLLNSSSVALFGMLYPEGDDVYANHLLNIQRTETAAGVYGRPCGVIDRLLAGPPKPHHLPAITLDSSTGLTYWPVLARNNGGESQPRIIELKAGATDRRQHVSLGETLYIAGGILHAFDGQVVAEAGGFLDIPYIYELDPFNGSGSITPGGIYQVTAAFEIEDSRGNRVQSGISDVAEVTMPALEDTIGADCLIPPTLWDTAQAEFSPTEVRGIMAINFYRTLDTAAGNITFHLDLHQIVDNAFNGEENGTLLTSDTDLQDEEPIYTQAARGALSGPLEFICPDPCTTLTASADRILSGGLPRASAFQESRPLLVGEQVQWSDSIGFYRDVRGRLLAVARLDERRIMFTGSELFEADGPGLDDNGFGDIGAPRRLPSDVGIYGGVHAWRSLVEISAGLLFQGLRTQIYLLPRGGVTPVPIGFAVEDTLDLYPDISSAVYVDETQTVHFTCNNEAGDESIVLLFNVRFTEWFVEGPYSFGIRAGALAGGRYHLLTTDNTVLRQRDEDTPLAHVDAAWRSGGLHPWKHGMYGRHDAVWFYGGVLGDCRIRAIVRYDELDTETGDWVDVFERDVGSQFVHRFSFNQMKCESMTVDFEVTDFQGRASAGLEWNYFALEGEPADAVNQVGPEDMT